MPGLKNVLIWPLQKALTQSTNIHTDMAEKLLKEADDNILAQLSKHAAQLTVEEDAALAIDWLNGRRAPDANQLLEGAITGLNLATDAPEIFRSIVESTCFGAKAIVDRFNNEGIVVKGLIGLGGVARKSPFIMQMMADIMNMPIRIRKSEQTCALGAAMFAATAAGIYPKVEEAMHAMGQGFDREYSPDVQVVMIYAKRYERYKKLGNFIEQQLVDCK